MRRMYLPCVVFLLAPCSTFGAPPVTDPAFLQAAVVLGAFDRLAGRCRAEQGFAPAQQAVIHDWQRVHKTELIRARLPQLTVHSAQQAAVDGAIETIVSQLTAKGLAPCPAATSLTRLPQAQFTEFAAAHLVTSDAVPAATLAPEPARPLAAPAGAASAQELAAIDSIGFHTRPKMGIGGFITLDVFPVLLLRSGELVKDVAALREPGGFEAHRAAHPDAWTQWRRAGGRIELMTAQGWAPLGVQTTYATLPPGLALNGRYRSLAGVGNLAVGGSDSVLAWDAYRFTPDGQIEREGGAGGSAAFGDTGVATSARTGVRRGRYRIEGLALAIDYEDGGSERRILVVDPANPRGALWLDGEAYVERD